MDTGRRILIPLDHSPLAEAVVPRAAALAQALGCGLTLFEVITPETPALPLGWPAGVPVIVREGWADQARMQASDYLQGIARRLTAQGLDVQTEVLLENDVVCAIVERARQDPAVTLIAMGTHARSGFSRLVFGSVAECVLHETPVPLLLQHGVDDEEARPRVWSCAFQTVLVPLDGSLVAEQALARAREIAHATGATLILTTIVPELDDAGLAEGGVEPYWKLAEARIEADRQIHGVEQRARELAEAGISVRVEVGNGDPAAEILRIAGDEHADLIVMSTHGRSGLRRLWLGSVANEVVRGSTLPVLLIRADAQHSGQTQSDGAHALHEAC